MPRTKCSCIRKKITTTGRVVSTLAAMMISQAGLAGQRVGGAELSERDANFVVAQPGTSARDILRLIDMIRSRVKEQTGVELELEITVW